MNVREGYPTHYALTFQAQNGFFLIFQEHKNTPPGQKRAISIIDSSIRV